MQDIVKANPSSAQLFYESLHGILNAHLNVISNNENTIKDISNLPIIKNPQSVRAKGRKSNKRKLSNLEQNSAIQRPRKVRNYLYFIVYKYIINFNVYNYLYLQSKPKNNENITNLNENINENINENNNEVNKIF